MTNGKNIPTVGSTVGSITTITGPKLPLGSDALNYKLDEDQFKRLQRTLLVGFVTMGYLANGGRLATPGRRAELDNLILEAEGLL